ncbi:hypothetical protein [Alkalihalobacillus sp. 1P02AB]|uniref:hypothetical protein n=1 Tax=Alkalihalobacillus sp. 1P02AB TaxID=3132260 RepID=UPI0039A61C9C
MALIRQNEMKKISKVRNRIHDEVTWSYSTFNDGRKKYLQIDTYGTKTREFKGSVSQSIQFDKETAEELIVMLQKEFGL